MMATSTSRSSTANDTLLKGPALPGQVRTFAGFSGTAEGLNKALREFRTDAGNVHEGLYICASDRGDASEVCDQLAFERRACAWNLVERRLEASFTSAFAMVSDRKAVGFISQALKQVTLRGSWGERDRILGARHEDTFRADSSLVF